MSIILKDSEKERKKKNDGKGEKEEWQMTADCAS